MLAVPWSSNTGVNDVPAFAVFHTPPYADATYQMLLSLGSTARSTMRPEVTAGPIERNLSPANVAALNFASGLAADLAADFPAGFDSGFVSAFAADFAAGFDSGFVSDFAAGFDASFASGFAADFVVPGFAAGAGAATATTDASASPSSVNEK